MHAAAARPKGEEKALLFALFLPQHRSSIAQLPVCERQLYQSSSKPQQQAPPLACESKKQRDTPTREDEAAAAAAENERRSLLHTLASLIFAYLPLSIQAITLPALSKAWKQWAQDERAKERALEQAERVECCALYACFDLTVFCVPLWAAK